MSEVIDFWRGDFGNAYTERNRVDWHQRIPFWRHIIELTQAQSFLDVGCNAGWNLLALREIDNEAQMSGVDVNTKALAEAEALGFDVLEGRAQDLGLLFLGGSADMVITSGVLIHIPPDEVQSAMRAIVEASNRWVVAIEYQADESTEVEYRGHAGRLWKRPYGDLYAELGLSVVEFGPADGFDDCTFWLLEKA